ncbi:MAG: hypothetical protein QOI57_752 [Rubrobacteraceae bacterium]|nr:hypothetical protein [Rubrobacteraceae bacterium]
MPQRAIVKRLINKMVELIRKEAPAAGPAARDAAAHSTREFAKKFWEKYTENRGKTLSILLCSDFATDIWRARSLVVRYL